MLQSRKPQLKYHLGTVSISLLGLEMGWGLNQVLQDPNPRPVLLQWFETFSWLLGPHGGLVAHH